MPIILPPSGGPGIATAPGPGVGGFGYGPFNETAQPFTNPSTARLSYIGPVGTAWEVGLPVWETPFPEDPKEYAYKLKYKVKASAFVRLARDAAGPYGGYHIGESNFETSIGGILTFIREFAMVPDSRNELETYTHPYQLPIYGDSPHIEEVPLTVTSRVQFDYFHTNQPEAIPLPRAPKALLINGAIYLTNGFNTAAIGDQILAQDAVLRAWKGKIYEREQRFIEHRTLVSEVLG